jgi:hypothetical protein
LVAQPSGFAVLLANLIEYLLGPAGRDNERFPGAIDPEILSSPTIRVEPANIISDRMVITDHTGEMLKPGGGEAKR